MMNRSIESLLSFIKLNAASMSVEDISKETGATVRTILTYMKKLHLMPVAESVPNNTTVLKFNKEEHISNYFNVLRTTLINTIDYMENLELERPADVHLKKHHNRLITLIHYLDEREQKSKEEFVQNRGKES